MSANLERSYLSKIEEAIKMERFDYNPIPESVLEEFQNELDRNVSIEQVEAILDQTVVIEIIKLLDIKKEMRAKNLVTETQKNSFIAQKAKESGITADQLEQVMNSSYLYIPYINKFNLSRNDDEDEVNISLAGGLLWYHIIAGDAPGLEKIATVSSRVSISQDKDNSWKATELEAIHSAAETMGINLKTRTRELDMFKLLAPIAEAQGRHVKFPLGEQEGIKLDQPYYVGEWRRNQRGQTKFHKDGFVRVGSVADENSHTPYISSAWAIKKGDWARGMVVMEHPRLGIDFSLKTRIFPVNIDSGLFIGKEDNDDIAAVFNSYSGFIPALDLDINANIANATGIRQSFLTFGFTGALVPAKSKIIYDDVIADIKFGDLTIFEIIETKENINSFAFYMDGHLGYLKKYYLGRIALHWEAKAGIQAYSITANYKDDVSLMNISFGGRFNLGLEYALNIDTNIGIYAGFNAFPAANLWIVKREDDKVPVLNDFENYSWPKISSIGRTYGLYFHYSVPALPFSPGSLISNAM